MEKYFVFNTKIYVYSVFNDLFEEKITFEKNLDSKILKMHLFERQGVFIAVKNNELKVKNYQNKDEYSYFS